MSEGITTMVYPVKDLAKSRALLEIVTGKAPDFDQPYYVGWQINGQDIGLDPNGHAQGMTGPTAFYRVDDLRDRLARLLAAGATLVKDVTDVGGGKLVASVKDADGNMIGVLQDPQ